MLTARELESRTLVPVFASETSPACRQKEAFRRMVIGCRSNGSRKSTYVQEIRFPASSAWCPAARY